MEKVIKEKLHTKKILLSACFSRAVNRDDYYYVYLNKDDMERRFFRIGVPFEIRTAYLEIFDICKKLADMEITANLKMHEKYNVDLDQVFWHFWLETTNTGWVTYKIAGGQIIT